MKLIRSMYGELNPWGRFWLCIGFVTLIAAALMSMDFGASISVKHALFLGCLTIVAAFAPDAAHQQWRAGAKPTACIIGAICVPLLMIEFYSHAGYTAGLRGANVQTAHIQNTKYDDGRAQVADNAANLKLWKEQLAKLTTENGWAATISADGLRADLETANEAVRQEESRGGCGPRCMAKMKSRDEIASKIAVVEKSEDLTKRIEATQRLVDKYRVASAGIEHKVSSVDLQNQFLAKAVALVSSGSLEPTELEDAGSDQVINFSLATAGTGLPALCFFLAGCFRWRRTEDYVPEDMWSRPAKDLAHVEIKPAAAGIHNSLAISDERAIKYLKEMAARMKLPSPAAA
jgi:hypothetical protein